MKARIIPVVMMAVFVAMMMTVVAYAAPAPCQPTAVWAQTGTYSTWAGQSPGQVVSLFTPVGCGVVVARDAIPPAASVPSTFGDHIAYTGQHGQFPIGFQQVSSVHVDVDSGSGSQFVPQHAYPTSTPQQVAQGPMGTPVVARHMAQFVSTVEKQTIAAADKHDALFMTSRVAMDEAQFRRAQDAATYTLIIDTDKTTSAQTPSIKTAQFAPATRMAVSGMTARFSKYDAGTIAQWRGTSTSAHVLPVAGLFSG